jgi:hypothetical protein
LVLIMQIYHKARSKKCQKKNRQNSYKAGWRTLLL